MGGLEPFLNSTVDKHNDMDYSLFVLLCEAGQNYSAIARQAKVSHTQAKTWVKIYEEEKGTPRG